MKNYISIVRKHGNKLCFLLLTQRYHKHPLVVEDEDEGGPEPPVQTQASPNRSKAEPEPLTHAELCSLVPGKTEETEIEMQVGNAPGVLMGHEKLDSGLLFCFLTFIQMFPSHRVTGKESVKVKPQPISICRLKHKVNLLKALFVLSAAVDR